MKTSRKAKAIVSAVVVLLLAILSCPPALAVEPYGPAKQGTLNVGFPGGNTPSGGGNSQDGGSQGGGTSQGGEASRDEGIKPGVKITISGGGFAPFAKYDILWDGKVLIDPYADENGFASYEFTIPASAASGIHSVSMQGEAASGGTLVLSSNVKVKAKEVAKTVKRGTENKALLPAEDTGRQKGAAKTLERGTKKTGKKAKAFPFTSGGIILYALIACIVLAFVGFGMKIFLRARDLPAEERKSKRKAA